LVKLTKSGRLFHIYVCKIALTPWFIHCPLIGGTEEISKKSTEFGLTIPETVLWQYTMIKLWPS